ncbi:N-acetylmuramoyl-L-alanine amidase [Marinobacter sp.]|uniref:N-acetylmuramoyl-L-alanine amidase n=1 Tax=Marinobacter sp. TaxID=50741 RepID=UPI0019A469BB|nr:N-acetylmuramoyl-L-alanine amidase [Marinobacter sp.]MBC7193913.1 N-acetylmuramoyl-L-alanine amidase [Marinobacter sp.]
MAQYKFREMLLTPGRGGRPGRKITPKALVIHWTANLSRGADATANRNYFENHPENKVSAHYIVDDHQVVQCIPEDEMAYHVGAKVYRKRALQELGSYPNNCTIGIETCVNADGDFKKTYQNLVELTASILKRHGWGTDRLWRHFDVTGKDCPKFFVTDATAKSYGFPGATAGWEKFKRDVSIELKAREVLSMFRDVTKNHWAASSIERLAQLGIIKGDAQGNFRPEDPITRAEVAALLDRILKLLGK